MPTSSKAEELFIERMGLAAEAEGLTRIAGRMNGLFFLYGGPFSFSELAQRLQVSRASVSTNVRMLRDLGILEQVSKPGDRQDYYQLAEHPFSSLMAGYLKRMEHMERIVREADDAVGDKLPEAHGRLQNMARFYAAAKESAQALVERLDTLK
jgi:DNA-binding transcriptional regulator GbsR (MarR family)